MKLTTRQWTTYSLISNNSHAGRKTTIGEIIGHYPITDYEDGYTFNKKTSHDPCRLVWQDIVAINASSEIEKIIIIDNFTYHLATEEEAMAYYKRLRSKALKAMARAYCIKLKIKADGQGKLISCHGDPIDEESKARRFVEAFLEEKGAANQDKE
jgi:hypothetical protein